MASENRSVAPLYSPLQYFSAPLCKSYVFYISLSFYDCFSDVDGLDGGEILLEYMECDFIGGE